MFNNDYAQLARDRRQAHEDYIAKRSLTRGLIAPQTVSLTGLTLLLAALLGLFFANGCVLPNDDISVGSTAKTTTGENPNKVAPAVITAAELTGRFRVYDRAYPSAIEFGADGRFCRATSIDKLATAPVDVGRWYVEGELLILISDETVSNCGEGLVGRYRLSNYSNGGILFERQSEECEARIGYVPTATSQPLQSAGILCTFDTGELCARP